jgi:hypothetical protein
MKVANLNAHVAYAEKHYIPASVLSKTKIAKKDTITRMIPLVIAMDIFP